MFSESESFYQQPALFRVIHPKSRFSGGKCTERSESTERSEKHLWNLLHLFAVLSLLLTSPCSRTSLEFCSFHSSRRPPRSIFEAKTRPVHISTTLFNDEPSPRASDTAMPAVRWAVMMITGGLFLVYSAIVVPMQVSAPLALLLDIASSRTHFDFFCTILVKREPRKHELRAYDKRAPL